nr:peptidase domain-containing ABC transporter [Synechococcus sp. AH-779-G23]
MLRPDEIPGEILLVFDGEVRFLVGSGDNSMTLVKRGSGQFLGWSSVLRAEPCEWVQASNETTVIAFPSFKIVELFLDEEQFSGFFANLAGLHESYRVATAAAALNPRLCKGWDSDLKERAFLSKVITVNQGEEFIDAGIEDEYEWFVSSARIPNFPVGALVSLGDILPINVGFNLPYRLIGLPKNLLLPSSEQMLPPDLDLIPSVATQSTNLEALGIVEDDYLDDNERFPSIRGRGQMAEALAVIEMICLYEKVPFRRDVLEKVLEDQFRRDKGLSIELLGGLCELVGLRSQLGEADSNHLSVIEAPALLMLEGIPTVFYGAKAGAVILGHPHNGLVRVKIENVKNQLGDRFRFVNPRRVGSTPTSRFGWGWFTPLLGKYKKSLIIVFIASLLAQLFGLAIPLMIQQIIDKTLSQGNLSSLNVLGSAMVVMALFQGLLKVLRTYIFVDTTDRMDLTLGTSVIDRLLSLPLSYFEKRPVGELSQRLGELNTIRSFLTGTALVSVLNIIFATVYLAVMLVYSPVLTAIALSTLPVYLLLVFGVAPIYRNLIRKRAVAQAKTQSHLIEILGGIQTVKAQHFELTARWKWQDRYRHFVDEGFKSSALGSASGEIGGFLNQLSGLLILWFGMGMVIEGNFTIGQLIAFRIIAGNVTGPLLQLSGLYQGFQKVQLSMERLSDILDQSPELGNHNEIGQISMPPISGAVRFENVTFRFGSNGPAQVNNVSIDIPPGSFVGVVGQSGSGKSTLMKLLPRLYSTDKGRIFIDDYDIAKVDLSSLRRQIGIVPQDSLLFEGTISENISLNDPQASNESIIEVAKIACAHDFIMSLGQGYATPIAERGSNLSGGQRQRLAIARTLLSNPQLLVLDEATSALDFDTERQLCFNLQEWASERTVFFITHRLSTIRNSNIILVMHQGSLVEHGSHSELESLEGRYSALARQQDAGGE